MVGELPKLVGRDFVVGFFLPAAVFALGGAWLANLCDPAANALCRETAELRGLDFAELSKLAAFAFGVWLLALLLLSLNRSLYRLLEGYGRLNPFRLVQRLEARRYDRLQRRIDETTRRARAAEGPAREAILAERGPLLYRRSREFPGAGRLLPTRFGNAIRSFEDYSLTMYGLDDIAGWPRLLGVLPKDYVRYVDEAKAQTDFWVNVWCAAALLLLSYAALLPGSSALGARWWIPLACVAVAWYAVRRGTAAVFEWGEMVKASYDVFLPDLGKRIGMAEAPDRDAARARWQDFSLAITYRMPKRLPVRAPVSGKPPPPEG
jgi:hypothetical protein